jgi:hypothetical protein
MDNNVVDVVLADKLMGRIKERYPAAKLGAGLIFRDGQLRALDSVLSKDIWLMNLVNWGGETAMSYFDGIEGRELVVFPRITDDAIPSHEASRAYLAEVIAFHKGKTR